jgi:glycosyltransferase involved in cell wall biosynthesis
MSESQEAIITDTSNGLAASDTEIVVSAIVSVYNAKKYIKGCLEDLLSQSMADRLEIIVVDSGSEQDEATIVADYQKHHSNINYIRTAKRETVYAAWNRGIRFASGRYITNANADDRHRKDAFEIMAATLDQRPDIALVYADLLITENENETFDQCTPAGRFGWLDWDRQKLLEGNCFMGPQPMWRKTLHEEYGYFRPDFVTSGDYEFWLRASQTHNFLHLPVVLGLYLKSVASIEHSNREAQRRENLHILKEYRSAAENGIILNRNLTEGIPEPSSIPCQPQAAPASPNEIITQALDDYWYGNLIRVSELLERIQFDKVIDTDLVTTAATLYVDMGRYREALDLITNAFQHSVPPELAALMARALIGMEDYDRATETLRISLSGAPDCAPLLTANGLLHLEMADYAQSIRSFKKAITSVSDSPDAHINLGLAYLHQGDVSAAFNAAKHGFQLTNPSHSNIAKMAWLAERAVSAHVIDRLKIDRMFTIMIGAYPQNKVLIYQYISDLLSQERVSQALEFIELALARFGYDDGILQHAVSVRNKVGPMRLVDEKNLVGTISLCALVGIDCPSLVERLATLKDLVHEIIVVAIDATTEALQVAKTFGAQIYRLDDYPLIESPWDLATQMAVGEQCLRIDLRSSDRQ